jgi:hypothetical protein
MMDINKLAKECDAVLFIDGQDNLYCINFRPSDLELFARKIKAARDAEWMVEPFGYYWNTTTSDESGIVTADEIKDYPEWQLEEMQPLYAQPKEVK